VTLDVRPVGTVRCVSDDEALLELLPALREGLSGIAPGERLDVLYWMHLLKPDRRGLLRVHPRGDASRPLRGVFGLRSPMRPNPIGVSSVRVLRVEGTGVYVTPFDAKDGSPIVDLKAGTKGAEIRRLVRFWGVTQNAVIHSLEDALGPERLKQILYRPMYELGREEAPEAGPDARAIGRGILRLEESWELQGRVVEDRPDRFVREVTTCPWSHMGPLGCRVFAWYMEGLCAGMNEAYSYQLERLIPEGSESCA
jgi:tRNA-Thr(GGU) m(6)t(6)A37 methyltransferase TsaA